MASEYVLGQCWNCGTARIAARFGGEVVVSRATLPLKWVCLFVCNKCTKGTVVELQSSRIDRSPGECLGDPRSHEFTTTSEYPTPVDSYAPSGVPQNIKRWFDEGVAIMATSSSGSVGVFRKTLEATLNHIDKQSSNARLSDRITKLCDEHKLTAEMGEWAQAIRTIGGRGVHNDDPTKEQVEQTRHFTYALLQYIFTLPTFIKQHNKEQSQKNQGRRRSEAT